MSDTLLQLKGLSVSYGPVEAVHQVDLDVRSGEIVTVIGPNGAGKTTLLSAAMGLLPSRGEIHLDGKRIARPGVEVMVANGVALVPEKRELFGEMSVEDNLLLVEQNARAALKVADRAYVLEMGAVALSGAARELLHDRRIIDTYLGMGRSAEAAAVA